MFSSYFPSNLKNADITPVFKKKDRENVENYRPVSILPVLSKVYERCMYHQMYAYLSKFLYKWQCGIRQGYSTQHYLLIITEKWRQCLDKGRDKWSITNWSFKSFWLPLTWSFNCQTCLLWFWLRLFGRYTKLPLWKATKNQS